MNNQNNWLKTAEYLSVSAAVVGTVASKVSGQALMATTPLSIALMLNLINRRRADMLIQKDVGEGIQQINHDFLELNDLVSGSIETLRQQLLALPSVPEQIDFSPMQGVIETVRTELESRLQELEHLDVDSVRQGLNQLQAEIEQFQTQLQDLTEGPLPNLTEFPSHSTEQNEEFNPAEMFDINSLDKDVTGMSGIDPYANRDYPNRSQTMTLSDLEIKHLQEWQDAITQEVISAVRLEVQNSLASLTSASSTAVQQGIQQLQTEAVQLQDRLRESTPSATVDLSPLYTQIEQLAERLDRLPLANDSSRLEIRLDDLQAAIAQLAEDTKNAPANEDTALVFSAMRSLYERQNAMEQDFITTLREEIQSSLTSLSLPDLAAIRTEFAQLQSEIVQLRNQLQAGGQNTTTDLGALQTQFDIAFTQLQAEMVQIQQKMQEAKAAPEIDLSPLQTQISLSVSQLQTDITRMQTKLQELTRLQETAKSPTIDLLSLEAKMHQGMTGLRTELAQLQHKLRELAQPPTVDVALLQAQMNDGMAQLRDEIIQLQRQIRDVTLPASELESAHAPINAGLTQLQTDMTRLQTNLQEMKRNLRDLQANMQPSAPIDITPLQMQIHQLSRRIEEFPKPFDGTSLEQQIANLSITVGNLQQTSQTTSNEDSEFIFSAMRSLYDRQNAVEQDFLTQVRSEIQQQLAMLPAPDISTIQTGLTQLRADLTQLQQSLRDIAPPIIDFSPMQGQVSDRLSQLQSEISRLQNQVYELANMPIDLTPIQEQFNEGLMQLQAEVAELQARMQHHASPPVDLTPIQTQINQINQQIAQLPPPFDPAPLEHRVEDLKAAIDLWREDIENSPMREDFRIFFAAMRGLTERQK